MLVGRDARLQPLVTLAGEIEVDPAGAVGGPGAGGGYEPLETFAPLIPLGLTKPPMAVSARQAMAQTATGGVHVGGPGISPLDARIEAKKAELLSRLTKK